MHGAPIGMALVSLEGSFIDVNASFCRMLGYPHAVLVTKSFQEITDPAHLGQDLEGMRKLIAGIEDDLRGQRDKAMLLIGYAGAFRRSELVGVTVADLTFYEDRVSILLPRSKTDQEGAGKTKTIAVIGGDLCPVTALRTWIATAGIEAGHVFRGIDRHGHVHEGLNDREVARIVKKRATAAGLDPKKLAGHSLRAGFVTQNALAGIPDWKIAEQTGHKPGSKVLHDYIRAAGKGAMDASRAAFGE